YPTLKADQEFLSLQQELINTEDRIQAARRFYNGNVRDFNTRIAVFPAVIIAFLTGFRREEYFEIEQTGIRSVPPVNFPKTGNAHQSRNPEVEGRGAAAGAGGARRQERVDGGGGAERRAGVGGPGTYQDSVRP